MRRNEKIETDHDQLMRNFIENDENTLSSQFNNSVAQHLFKLKEKYLSGTEEDTCRKIKKLLEILKEKHRARLDEEVDQQKRENLEQDFYWVQEKIKEDINELDQITFYHQKNERKFFISLAETLALAVAKLTDSTLDDNPTKHEEKLKFSPLWQCFKELRNDDRVKKICHLGVRDRIILAIYGDCIEDINSFLTAMVSEHVYHLLQDIKAQDIGLYIKILRAYAQNSELPAAWKIKVAESKNELSATINKRCLEHGINPASITNKIEGYANALMDIALPLGNDSLLPHYLTEIFTPTLKSGSNTYEHALNLVQSWIQTNNFNNFDQQIWIEHFATVKQLYYLFNKYSQLIYFWSNEQLTQEDIKKLDYAFSNYFEQCIQAGSPTILPETFSKRFHEFRKVFDTYHHDQQILFITNFFSNWHLCNLNEKILLYQQLRGARSSVLVREELTKYLLSGESGILNLDPYLINRILLSAMLISPLDWSEQFYALLGIVYKFVSTEFTQDQNYPHGLSKALKKDSYSEELLSQIKFLTDYYAHLHLEQPKPSAVNFVIPMPYFVFKHLTIETFHNPNKDLANEFNRQLSWLDLQETYIFLAEQAKDIRKIIGSADRLLVLMERINQRYQLAFLQILEIDKNAGNIINNTNELDFILRILAQQDRLPFLNNFLRENFSIKVGLWLADIFELLNPKDHLAFLEIIAHNLIKNIITSDDLAKVLEKLSSNARMPFLNRFSYEDLMRILKADLMTILHKLPKKDWLDFLTKFNSDDLINITRDRITGINFFNSSSDLCYILKMLEPKECLIFLNNFNAKNLPQLVSNGYHLLNILSLLTKKECISVIDNLGESTFTLTNEEISIETRFFHDRELAQKINNFIKSAKIQYNCHAFFNRKNPDTKDQIMPLSIVVDRQQLKNILMDNTGKVIFDAEDSGQDNAKLMTIVTPGLTNAVHTMFRKNLIEAPNKKLDHLRKWISDAHLAKDLLKLYNISDSNDGEVDCHAPRRRYPKPDYDYHGPAS